MHLCTKNKLNWFINSAIIGADACTHSPPSQTIFTTFLDLDIYLYIYPTPIYKANKNLLRFTDSLLPHMHALNYQIIYLKIIKMCSIPHEEILPQNVFFTSP